MFAYNTLIVMLGTALLGAVAGALGTYLVLRRRALIGDALSHATYPGICLAFWMMGTRNFVGLLVGALGTALLGAWTASAIRRHTRLKDDAAIGIVLSVFFGAGIVFSRIIQNVVKGANKAGLDTFIFGKTAGMLRQDVYGILAVAALVLVIMFLLRKEFNLLSFDHDFAAVQGWPVGWLDLLMMALACVVTIIGLPAVGLALMAALLIIPAATARFWTDDIHGMLWLSAGVGLATGLAGTLVSAAWASLPTGPIIILIGSALFTLSLFISPKRGLIARAVLGLGLRRRIEDQHLLRTLYELNEPAWPQSNWVEPEHLTRLRAWTPAQAHRQLRRGLKRGWVREDQGRYALTDEGWQAAAQVVRAHRLWEIFLIEEANIAPNFVDRDAERLEHVLPPELVARLECSLYERGLVPKPLGQVPPRHCTIARQEEEALA